MQILAELVNNRGITCSGKTIILTEDIDLSSISNWRPIGSTSSKAFQGTFNGNGHTIKNLTITSGTSQAGLFGVATGEIKNVGIVGGSVTGSQCTGCLAGTSQGTITNCYATGSVSGKVYVGGLVGSAKGAITNCYASSDVTGSLLLGGSGGLVGQSTSSITSSYATGNVTGSSLAGGLVGTSQGAITNCYATGNVTGGGHTGGLVGISYGAITNCYASSDVTGSLLLGGSGVGGLVGYSQGAINNAYATGNVTGSDSATTGSFIGVRTSGSINNCQAKEQDINKIGSGANNALLSRITYVEIRNIPTILQVGINSESTSQIEFDTNFSFDLSALTADITSDEALDCILNFIDTLSSKSTELGAVSNRLESALESISVNIENLTSSRSTIKDADIAKVSSEYIRQQILQQASATLLSTANQTPSIALQLI